MRRRDMLAAAAAAPAGLLLANAKAEGELPVEVSAALA